MTAARQVGRAFVVLLAVAGAGCATTNGAPTDGASTTVSLNGADDAELAALLAEVENLSDEEAARLLAEEQRGAGG